MTAREVELLLPRFEGLVSETARQIVAEGVELETDDVRQLLRLKIWRAILAHDAAHRRSLPLRRYVFMCVMNLRKDLVERRPRRYNSSIEDIRARASLGSDWFDQRYLSVDAEQVYGAVGDELRLPHTLDATERRLVTLTMQDQPVEQIENELGLSSAQRKLAMRAVREKLADWQPSRPRSAPTPPLPAPEPARIPLAA